MSEESSILLPQLIFQRNYNLSSTALLWKKYPSSFLNFTWEETSIFLPQQLWKKHQSFFNNLTLEEILIFLQQLNFRRNINLSSTT
jgi:hypothetical protein